MSDKPRHRAGRTVAGRRRLRHSLTIAAIDLFLDQGYETTTVDDIASAAGVGRRTFFRYFRSKDDAIFPDHDEILGDITQMLATADTARNPIEVACEAVGVVLDFYLADPDVSLKRYALTHTVSSLRDKEVASVDRYQRVFASYLRSRFETDGGPLPDLRASVAAAAIAAAHNHVLRRWLRSDGDHDVRTYAHDAFQFMLDTFPPGGRHPATQDTDTVVAVLRTSAASSDVVRHLNTALPDLQ